MSYTQLSHDTPKARKRYRCDWCWEWIEKGDAYVRTSGVNDGEMQTCKFHPECDEACTKEAKLEGHGFTFMPGDYQRGKGSE